MSEKCQNPVPRGHICPLCGNEHDQVKPKIGAGIAIGILVLIATGIGFYMWNNRGYGGYDAYGSGW